MTERLGRNLFVREPWNIGTLGRMLDSDGANVPVGVDVEQCVFVEVAGLRNRGIAEFDKQRVSFRKIANSHGSNRRSKNAL